MSLAKFAVGDWVIYRKLKHSASPGSRACDISPSASGELYSYFVDKFWIVQEVLADGQVKLRTRTGKIHVIRPSDPNLCRATWWQRWMYRHRFQQIQTETSTETERI